MSAGTTSHTASGQSGQPRTARASHAAQAAALVVYVWLAWSFRSYTPDDSFIFLRYAENLAGGRGLVFNTGERVQGYTSAVWTLWIAAGAFAGVPLLAFAKISGAILGAGCLVLAQVTARRIDRRAASAAPLLLAGFIDLPYWAVTGMDAALFAFVVAGALVLTLRADQPASRYAAALAWGVAGITRPEGALFGVVALGWLMRDAMPRRDRLIAWAVFVLPIAAWALFAWTYYGDPLPNTYWAKRFDRAESLHRGLVFLRAFLSANDGAFLAAAVAAALCFRLNRAIRLIAWLLGVYVVYLLWTGGDSWVAPGAFRFAVPVLVPISVAMAAGLGWIWERLAPAVRPRAFAAVTLVVWLVFPSTSGFVNRQTAGDPAIIAHLQANAAPADVIAVTDIGYFACRTDLRVIDTFGLVDRHVARSFRKLTNSSYAAGEDLRLVDYLLERAPRWIILKATAAPDGLRIADETGAPAIYADARFRRDYRFVMSGAREPYLLFERGR